MTGSTRLSIACLALMLSVPFLWPVSVPPIATFWPEWIALALGALACMHLAVSATTRVPLIAWGFAGLAAAIGLQVLIGLPVFPSRSLLAVGYCLWAAALATLGRTLFRERAPGLVPVLQKALAVAAFGESIVALMQAGRIEVFGLGFGIDVPAGLLGQRNHLANLVSCGLWSLAFLAAARRVNLATAALAAAPMVLALALCGSRSVWVYAALGAGLLLLPGADRAFGFTRLRGWRARTAIALAVVLALALAQALLAGASVERLAATAQAVATASAAEGDDRRLALLRTAWAMFAASPAIGAGFGEFAWHALALAPQVGAGFGEVIDYHAHNLLAQLAAETGAIGALCIVVPLALWAWGLLWTRGLRSAFIIPSCAWLIAIMGMQVWHGLVEMPQWHAHFLGLAALLLGMGSNPLDAAIPVERGPRVRGLATLAASLAVAFALWPVAADYRRLDAWRQDLARGGRMTAEQLAQLVALRDSTFGWKVEPSVAVLADGRTPEERASALHLVDRALHAHPQRALTDRAARLLEADGRRDQAAAIRRAARAAFGPEPAAGTRRPEIGP